MLQRSILGSVRARGTLGRPMLDLRKTQKFQNNFIMLPSLTIPIRHFSDTVKSKEPENTQTKGQENVGKLRLFIRTYGPVGVVVYGSVYVGTLGMLYGLVRSGAISATDVLAWLKSSHADEVVDSSLINPKAGDLALAWILTKFTEPIRLGISLTITPPIARFLGFVSTPPSNSN